MNYEIEENEDNIIISNIIESIFENICTFENKCYLIGSSVLYFARKIYDVDNNNFKFFSYKLKKKNNTNEIINLNRDIDLLVSDFKYLKILEYLESEFNIDYINNSNTYNTLELTSRNIIKIIKLKLTLDSNKGLISKFIYKQFNINININIDLIIYNDTYEKYTNMCNNNINNIVINWPISNMSRNFYCYFSKSDKNIIFGELTNINKITNLTKQYTLLNLIETIKSNIYEGDNNITKSGDFLINKKNITDNIKNASIYQKLNFILNSNNYSLTNIYKLNIITINQIYFDNIKLPYFSKSIINIIKQKILSECCVICSDPLKLQNNKIFISNCNNNKSPHIFHMTCILKYILPYLLYIFNSKINQYNSEDYPIGNKCPHCRELLIESFESGCIKFNNTLKCNDIIFDKKQFIKNIKIINNNN
jgi:hypothetical protein